MRLFLKRQILSHCTILFAVTGVLTQAIGEDVAWLTWRNGDSLKGSLNQSSDHHISWLSPAFQGPINVRIDQLGLIPYTFRKLGIELIFKEDDIFIPAQDHYEIDSYIDGSILTVSDAIWPGFTPDLLSIVLVTATQAKGTVLIHQKMFESRLFFVDKLIDMGAQIILCDPHRATVIGLDRKVALKSLEMTSPDIRAGVALLIAALSAQGVSTIHNIEQIDRGYQLIDERLNQLGAKITRKE